MLLGVGKNISITKPYGGKTLKIIEQHMVDGGIRRRRVGHDSFLPGSYAPMFLALSPTRHHPQARVLAKFVYIPDLGLVSCSVVRVALFRGCG